MPLQPGKAAIGSNIAELMHTGKYKQPQAIAIAESNARRHSRAMGGPNMPMAGMPSTTPPNRIGTPGNTPQVSPIAQFGRPGMPGGGMNQGAPLIGARPSMAAMAPQMKSGMASGGNVPQFAMGGFPSASEADPWYMRQESHGDQFHPGGMFGGSAPGRADTLPVAVATDSHILPADVISGLGDGNSLAGASVVDKMLHSGPHGIPLQRSHGAPQLRLPSAPRQFESTGGRRTGVGKSTVPIAASSGEYNVPPEGVYKVGLQGAKNMKLDPAKMNPRKIMDLGHDILDSMILEVRHRTIAKMKKLKPPAKD